MNELALFAGAGGGLLGSRLLGWRTVCAVERDPYRQAVLLARQQDGCLDPFPIWDDVRTFDGRPWRGIVDVVTAGFPCQPFSVAGKRRGADDERNGWPDTIRIIREVGPRFALLENVPGLLAHEYARTIFGDLAEAGFDAEWTVLGADDVGAPHRRKRLWILAHAERPDARMRVGREQSEASELGRNRPAIGRAHLADADGPARRRRIIEERGTHRRDAELTGNGSQGDALPDAAVAGLERHEPASITREHDGLSAECRGWWDLDPADEDSASESFVGRVANGVAHRLHRLAAIGDGQVPAVVVRAWGELYARVRDGRKDVTDEK